MSRDLTRDDLRSIISRGLDRTGGSYKALVRSFNLEPEDYKAAVDRVSVPDLHATLLHQVGLDHDKLTYLHHGRKETLTREVAFRAGEEIAVDFAAPVPGRMAKR